MVLSVVKIAVAIICVCHLTSATLLLKLVNDKGAIETNQLADITKGLSSTLEFLDKNSQHIALLLENGPTYKGKPHEQCLKELHDAVKGNGVRLVSVSFLNAESDSVEPMKLEHNVLMYSILLFHALFMELNTSRVAVAMAGKDIVDLVGIRQTIPALYQEFDNKFQDASDGFFIDIDYLHGDMLWRGAYEYKAFEASPFPKPKTSEEPQSGGAAAETK